MFNNRKAVSSGLCVTLYLDRKRDGKTGLGRCTERTIILVANLHNNIQIFKLLVSCIFAHSRRRSKLIHINMQSKGKEPTIHRAWRSRRGAEIQLYCFFNLGARLGWAALPPGMTRCPWYWRLVAEKLAPQTLFDPRTVQTAASRYTDWAIPAHHITVYVKYIRVHKKL